MNRAAWPFLIACSWSCASPQDRSGAPPPPLSSIAPSASTPQEITIAPPVAPPPPEPSASATASPLPLVAGRTLRYREIFTGSLPYHAKLQTWTLTLGAGGRFSLVSERAEAPENSLIEGRSKPFESIKVVARLELAGSWKSGARGALDLSFEGDGRGPIHCSPGRVQALDPGAVLHLTPIPGENANHATWKPAARRAVDVLGCDRSWLADEASWSDEPQPDKLPFADLPGVEYAHDNDDMVVQKGGLRRAPRP